MLSSVEFPYRLSSPAHHVDVIMVGLMLLCLPIQSAYGCSGGQHAFDSSGASNLGLQKVAGGVTTFTELIPDGTNGIIGQSTDLFCSWNSPCRWRTVTDGPHLTWVRQAGNPDPNLWRSVMKTDAKPTNAYAMLFPDSSRSIDEKGSLISDLIPCQIGDGELSFRNWRSPNAEIRICARPQGTLDNDFCSPPIKVGNPGPTFITIPGPKENPFELVIESKGFITHDDFIIIDDIEYNAQLCANHDKKLVQKSRPSLTTTPAVIVGNKLIQRDKSVCTSLNCDFNAGSSCTELFNSARSHWRIGSGQTGNKNTGIPGDPENPDGSYAYIEGPADNGVLEFPAYNLSTSRDLAFHYYRASVGSNLTARLNGDVLFSAPSFTRNSKQWLQSFLTLPSGVNQKLQFVASDLRQNHFIAIDGLRPIDSDGTEYC